MKFRSKLGSRRVNSDISFAVKSAVREYLTAQEMRTSAEVFDSLDELIKHHLDKAIHRAKESKRGTVQARDL